MTKYEELLLLKTERDKRLLDASAGSGEVNQTYDIHEAYEYYAASQKEIEDRVAIETDKAALQEAQKELKMITRLLYILAELSAGRAVEELKKTL